MTEQTPRNDPGEIQHTGARILPSPTPQQTHSSHRSLDGESLLSSQNHSSLKDKDIAVPSASKYQSWEGELFAPQNAIQKYSEDSIVPAVVLDVIPSAEPVVSNVEKEKRVDSKVAQITNIFKTKKEKDGGKARLTKVVFMPMRDYKKWFAKDDNGIYIGTEPSREWTEAELEEEFGAYRPVKSEKGTNAGSIDRMLNASSRGL